MVPGFHPAIVLTEKAEKERERRAVAKLASELVEHCQGTGVGTSAVYGSPDHGQIAKTFYFYFPHVSSCIFWYPYNQAKRVHNLIYLQTPQATQWQRQIAG